MATSDYPLAIGRGALGGAGTGAAIGSVGGPVGTAIGAGVGALVGGILGFKGQKQEDKFAEQQRKLLAKQAKRQKDLAAKQASVERRAVSQATEASNRAAKEDAAQPPPRVSTTEFALVQSMSTGTGSPFDSYIQRTYGRPQSSDPTV